LIIEKKGKVVKGLGGLFTVRAEDADGVSLYSCRAKGALHKDEEKLLIGDNVTLAIDTDTPDSVVIAGIEERKNAFIRPPMANLDYLFIVFAAARPDPVLEVVDKLIAIAIHNGVEPVAVITKRDLSDTSDLKYGKMYASVGIRTFVT